MACCSCSFWKLPGQYVFTMVPPAADRLCFPARLLPVDRLNIRHVPQKIKYVTESTTFTNDVIEAFDQVGLPQIPTMPLWMTWNLDNYSMDRCC